MLEQNHFPYGDLPLGEADEDDFEWVSMEELKAFRKYLKKSKMQKKRLYPAG